MPSLRTMLVAALLLAMSGVRAQYLRPDSDPMPTDLGRTWMEVEGSVYGARADAVGPLGGGPGYQRLLTKGDYNVRNLDELREALTKAKAGQVVYLDPAGDYDATTLVFAEAFVIEIPEGVTLASNRGANGSRGAVIYSDNFATAPLIRALGPKVRLTGVWLRGPDPKRRLEHHARSFNPTRGNGDSKIQHAYYYKFPVCQGLTSKFSGLEVDNCELSGWSHAAIYLADGKDHHIHHNYIHHNQMNGLGYGVSHGYGEAGVSLIEYNVFDANRHSIAGTGKPGNAYEARHNLELGISLSHCFDMHGGSDRQDGTNIAGDWLKIHHNTFRAPVMAIGIRGVPVQEADIHHNWFFQTQPGRQMLLPWPAGGATRVNLHDNLYGMKSPVMWDKDLPTYQEALAAAQGAYTAGKTGQARAWFSRALELAADETERSRAQLHLADCSYKDGLFYLARYQYEAALQAPGITPTDRAAVLAQLQRAKAKSTPAKRTWKLAFTDDFERAELGANWRVLAGDWRVEGGKLCAAGAPAEILINKQFAGCQRLEFDAVTPAAKPCDFSPALHSANVASGSVRDRGYLLQFGGAGNTLNRLLREDRDLKDRSVPRFIEPGKVHHIIAELAGDVVRLVVDGQTIVEARDPAPLVGPEHERVGLYLYRETQIDRVRVFTSLPPAGKTGRTGHQAK